MQRIDVEQWGKMVKQHVRWLEGHASGANRIFLVSSLTPPLAMEDQDLRKAIFHGLDLSGSYITGCNLREATFRNCTMDNLTFLQCNLDYVRLENCTLNRSDILHSDMTYGSLHNCSFYKSTLNDVDMAYAVITACNLYSCDTELTNLVLGGYDARGYLFYATYDTGEKTICIRAGCRVFDSFLTAQRHWKQYTVRRSHRSYASDLITLESLRKLVNAAGWVDRNGDSF